MPPGSQGEFTVKLPTKEEKIKTSWLLSQQLSFKNREWKKIREPIFKGPLDSLLSLQPSKQNGRRDFLSGNLCWAQPSHFSQHNQGVGMVLGWSIHV